MWVIPVSNNMIVQLQLKCILVGVVGKYCAYSAKLPLGISLIGQMVSELQYLECFALDLFALLINMKVNHLFPKELKQIVR